ncbi:MAG TPA: thiamine pyrophosphate-dependent dehydrogenase E1 component subunit alpha [Terriglobia bacterium]|nr:thiamine pyrophosphate-dependent dehydrogenase E1 component subunit alpha [Terriglobia bacterium]
MAAKKTSRARATELSLPKETLDRMLYYLKLTRAAEDRIERVLYRQGKIVGGVYTGRGQEAVGVGSAIQLRPGDVMLPNHRDFSAFLIRGFSFREIIMNWMARADAPTRGRENTLHLGSLSRGVIPIISHLGDTCPVACGVALTFKQRRKKNVALVTFGEGTTSRGDVHEAMNMASVMSLPVIFVCNNNAFAYSTPTEKQFAVKDLSARAAGYAMPGTTIDGNDVLAVYAAVRQAVERARAGQGPSFIECKTIRMTGHSAHDAAEYVPPRLLQAGAKSDPIRRLEKFMQSKRLLTPQRIQEIESTIQKEIDDAVAFAESKPMPNGADALQGVYCEKECWWEEERP